MIDDFFFLYSSLIFIRRKYYFLYGDVRRAIEGLEILLNCEEYSNSHYRHINSWRDKDLHKKKAIKHTHAHIHIA